MQRSPLRLSEEKEVEISHLLAVHVLKFYLACSGALPGFLWGILEKEDFPRPPFTCACPIASCGFVMATPPPAATVLGLLE